MLKCQPKFVWQVRVVQSFYLNQSKKELIVEPDIPKWQSEGGVKSATCHLLLEATKDLQNSREIWGISITSGWPLSKEPPQKTVLVLEIDEPFGNIPRVGKNTPNHCSWKSLPLPKKKGKLTLKLRFACSVVGKNEQIYSPIWWVKNGDESQRRIRRKITNGSTHPSL